jgi:hypothetical protein
MLTDNQVKQFDERLAAMTEAEENSCGSPDPSKMLTNGQVKQFDERPVENTEPWQKRMAAMMEADSEGLTALIEAGGDSNEEFLHRMDWDFGLTKAEQKSYLAARFARWAHLPKIIWPYDAARKAYDEAQLSSVEEAA